MHPSQLVQLAALVASDGPALVEGQFQLPASRVDDYWSASKCRFDRWGRTLKRHALAGAGPASPLRPLRAVVEEVLLGEVLARLWAALLTAYDRRRGASEAEPLVRSVLAGQLEARHRALSLLVHAPGIQLRDAMELNSLRRQTERWADLLLGKLIAGLGELGPPLAPFAAEPPRALGFAEDLGGDRPPAARWPLLVASLRSAFRPSRFAPSRNPDLNLHIAASVVASFPRDRFDLAGLFHSFWTLRLLQATDEAQQMLDRLWSEHTPLPNRR